MKYWTYIKDGQIYDADLDSLEEAQDVAYEVYEQEILNSCEELKNGRYFEEPIELIEFVYDDNNEKKIVQSVHSYVTFQYYHGDFVEHSVH